MTKMPTNHAQLAGRVTVGERGQIVIPAEVRDKLTIAPGDHLLALYMPNSDAVAFVPETRLARLIEQSGKQLAKSLNNLKHSEHDKN